MPMYTEKEIEERKAAGIKMNKLNCGWNIPFEMRSDIISRIKKLRPKNDVERRDKLILELAFIKDMNPAQIARLNNPLLVGMGNRSKGKPLSDHSIRDTCLEFAPEIVAYRKSRQQKAITKRRNALYKQRQQGTISRPTVCATCGSTLEIEQHHIIPLQAGGTDDYFNLISLCHDCHMKLHHTIYAHLTWRE